MHSGTATRLAAPIMLTPRISTPPAGNEDARAQRVLAAARAQRVLAAARARSEKAAACGVANGPQPFPSTTAGYYRGEGSRDQEPPPPSFRADARRGWMRPLREGLQVARPQC